MFTGSMVAVATPMNDDGSIDYKSYQNLIEFNNHSLVQFYHRNMAYLIILYILFLTPEDIF